ncbi:MAG: hypothetical protein WCK74_11515 [Gemmatimonadaceae bacterium]
MPTSRLVRVTASVAVLCTSGSAGMLVAQGAPAPAAKAATAAPSSATPMALSTAEIRKVAEAHVAVSLVHDSAGSRMAQARNKTLQAQQMLKDQLVKQVTEALAAKGFTDSLFEVRRFLISTDNAMRAQFDRDVAQITGQPLPIQAAAVPAGGGGGRGGAGGAAGAAGAAPQALPTFTVPEAPGSVHVAHVAVKFFTTPDSMGLLQAAILESRTALQHATLASRNPTNLQALQLHAGHIIHALDPSIVTTGPGKGFGAKKAATGIATHIELAAKTDGASAALKMHSTHIATAARTTAARADAIVALAKEVQGATTADAAAKLMGQIVSLCDQLLTGFDKNADGRATWNGDEGGLQQVQEHLTLMLAADKK